jgi:hypothetical protein
LVALAQRGLLAGVAEVQLRMTSLGLENLGPLNQLSGFPTVRRLMLAFTCGWLVLPIAALVAHRSRESKNQTQFVPMVELSRMADAGGTTLGLTLIGETTMIRKLKSGEFRLYSRKVNARTGRRQNLGTFSTRAEAEKHERAVQYFKRH